MPVAAATRVRQEFDFDRFRLRRFLDGLAADGMPMPTKQTSSLRSARAAAIVIISFGV